jgi:hypothetical protein
MKGLWKNKLSGYNSKGDKRKSQTFKQYVSDNSVYNIRNDKYIVDKDIFYLKNKPINKCIVYGKLDDFNKRRKYEVNRVHRSVRAKVRDYIKKSDWDVEIPYVYGQKSVDWNVS